MYNLYFKILLNFFFQKLVFYNILIHNSLSFSLFRIDF